MDMYNGDKAMASDHDLLLRLDTKVQLLCKQVTDDNQDIKESLTDIYNKIGEQNKNFIPWRWFAWVIGFIVVGIITMSGIVYSNALHINDNTHQIEIQHK